VYTEKNHKSSIIHLDKNDELKGLEHLDTLYQAILKKIVLKINYQSFKARQASVLTFYPFILKEFNNRWFLVGKVSSSKPILTLALDRIVDIDYDFSLPFLNEDFNGDEYYKNTIGVTVLNEDQLQEVSLKIDRSNAPYVLTKPFHHSQELLGRNDDGGVTIKLYVHLNYEFERLILGFGDAIEVLGPRILRKRMQKKMERAYQLYSQS